METVELQLDSKTLELARQLVASRHCTLDELITEAIEQLATVRAGEDAFLGMFAHEPELIDQVTESAMEARGTHPLRQKHG